MLKAIKNFFSAEPQEAPSEMAAVQELTLGHMIDVSSEFLRKQGYIVLNGNEAIEQPHNTEEVADTLKEVNDALLKLHHMVSAHCPQHAIVEGHRLIAGIKAVL